MPNPAEKESVSWALPSMQIVRPTVFLRFVIRKGEKILQQAWQNQATGEMEWRDVPIEEENNLRETNGSKTPEN